MDFLKNITPRDYQKKIFETCKEKNCLVVLPTGLGKTLIALMLAIERMKTFPGKKVLFLAPTKPLAEQHQNFFVKHVPELFADMQLFTGAVSADKRKKIWQTADMIFSTPQCIANDLKNALYDLKEVCLLIEDEAHRCIKNYDYNYIASEYKSRSNFQRIIGLTASPGSDKSRIKEICENLSIEEVEIRTRESEDVKEYLQELEFEKILIDFPEEFEKIRQPLKKIFNNLVNELKARNLLPESPSKTNLIKLQKQLISSLSRGNKHFNLLRGISICSSAIKLQHALELLETQTLQGLYTYMKSLYEKSSESKTKGLKQLVKKPEFIVAYNSLINLIAKKTEHPKMTKLVEIISEKINQNPNTKTIVFAQYRDTVSKIAKEMKNIKGIRAKIFVGQNKKTKGKEETGLSQKEQQKILEEFSEGKINLIASTSIGEEGLDIPEVDRVIFYEPIPSAIRKIQRAGRTARLKPGMLTILITKKTRDEAFYYVSKRKEVKMHSAIGSIKEEFSKSQLDKDIEKQKTIKDYFD